MRVKYFQGKDHLLYTVKSCKFIDVSMIVKAVKVC